MPKYKVATRKIMYSKEIDIIVESDDPDGALDKVENEEWPEDQRIDICNALGEIDDYEIDTDGCEEVDDKAAPVG
jgi:hypothetical protein